MATPVAIKQALEGLVGNALRLTADTANNVTQAADTWLRTVKKDMDQLSPSASVFLDPITATALGSVSNTSATMRVYGIVCRNQDSAPRYFRALGDSGGLAQGVAGQFFSQLVATRSAANSPTYAFASFPGGFPVASSTPRGASTVTAIATTTETGSSGATDATMWIVYST